MLLNNNNIEKACKDLSERDKEQATVCIVCNYSSHTVIKISTVDSTIIEL